MPTVVFSFFSTQNEGEGQHAAICLQLRPREHMATGVRQGQRVIQKVGQLSVCLLIALILYLPMAHLSLSLSKPDRSPLHLIAFKSR